MLTSSADNIFILVSMCASITTRAPTFRSAFFAALSFTRYFVVFSNMITTGLLFLSVIVKVSAVTAVTVPMIGSPWAYSSPTNKTTASKQRTNRFNIDVFSFLEYGRAFAAALLMMVFMTIYCRRTIVTLQEL